jgi:hypothetical protein
MCIGLEAADPSHLLRIVRPFDFATIHTRQLSSFYFNGFEARISLSMTTPAFPMAEGVSVALPGSAR